MAASEKSKNDFKVFCVRLKDLMKETLIRSQTNDAPGNISPQGLWGLWQLVCKG